MEKKDVLSKLCYYDKRNPECVMTDEEIEEREKSNRYTSCSCDNCFYGRTKMAEHILSIENNSDKKYTIEDIKKAIELAREGNIGYYAPNSPMFYYDKTYNEIIESFNKI